MSKFQLCERRDEWGDPFWEICAMRNGEPHSINPAAKTIAEVRAIVESMIDALDTALDNDLRKVLRRNPPESSS